MRARLRGLLHSRSTTELRRYHDAHHKQHPSNRFNLHRVTSSPYRQASPAWGAAADSLRLPPPPQAGGNPSSSSPCAVRAGGLCAFRRRDFSRRLRSTPFALDLSRAQTILLGWGGRPCAVEESLRARPVPLPAPFGGRGQEGRVRKQQSPTVPQAIGRQVGTSRRSSLTGITGNRMLRAATSGLRMAIASRRR